MRFDILTLFPEIFESPLKASILGRAVEGTLLEVHLHQIRDYTTDKHHVTDDAPYGGGGGMVMKAEPVVRAVRDVKEKVAQEIGEVPVIYLSPQGELLRTPQIDELAKLPGIILLCGNYEGIDERAIELVVDREISIGDYVLTGGELAALVLINAVARKIPGVLGNVDSAPNDSFEYGLLDFPHYTRPEIFEDKRVPEILITGHHGKIREWRRKEALRRTLFRRLDLLEAACLDEKDREWLEKCSQDFLEQKEIAIRALSTPRDDVELTIIKSLLDSEGIRYFTKDGPLSTGRIIPIPIQNLGATTIFVGDDQFDDARKILRGYLERMASNEGKGVSSTDDN
jgi:tRNA (guanine37-N1)-methyltransferase